MISTGILPNRRADVTFQTNLVFVFLAPALRPGNTLPVQSQSTHCYVPAAGACPIDYTWSDGLVVTRASIWTFRGLGYLILGGVFRIRILLFRVPY